MQTLFLVANWFLFRARDEDTLLDIKELDSQIRYFENSNNENFFLSKKLNAIAMFH